MRLLLWALVLWTLLGLIGSAASARRGDPRRLRQGLGWLLGIWVAYAPVLLGVSLQQPVRVLAPGQERCFGAMCFAVAGAEELPGFQVRGEERERLVRVSVRVANHSRTETESEPELHGYLVDAQGRRWTELAGLTGVRLTAAVAAGSQTMSQPVFRIAKDATGLGLVLTHGPGYTGRLVIGDAESLSHRPTVLQLAPAR